MFKRARGKLIVLEGSDGSGKTVQTELLLARFSRRAKNFDFPRYDVSLAGKLVGECLAGKHGDFLKLSPDIASLPYTVDRAGAKPLLREALEKGHVICNRYTPSNVAHQGAKLLGDGAQSIKPLEDFITFIEKLEYEELGIPKPDCVIFLHMPPAIAFELIGKKKEREHLKDAAGGRDAYEADKKYLEAVTSVYDSLAKQRDDWHFVACAKAVTPRPPQDIHEDVWKIVESLVS